MKNNKEQKNQDDIFDQVRLQKRPQKDSKHEEFVEDLVMGLTEAQVARRISQGQVNKKLKSNTKTVREIFFSNIFTFFNFLCALIAFSLAYVGAFADLVFLLIIGMNLIIGIIQELRAKYTLEKLSLVSAPIVNVIRAGKTCSISVSQIVLSDVMLLDSGKQISTDCVLSEGELEVNESLLTGESIPVNKKVGDKMFAGSFVVSGKCKATVIAVGVDNYVSKLALQAKKYQKPKSELLGSLKLIIKTIGIIIIPLGGFMFYNNYTNSMGDIYYTVTKTAGALVGMIPAGLFLLTSVTLALGSIKIAQQKALVQELYCIEMLARVNVLCLDKTGTITDGTMTVSNCIDLDKESEFTPSEIISSMLAALNDNNQTAVALRNHFGCNGGIKVDKVYSFNSEKKYSAVTFDNRCTYFIGAPEFLYRQKNEKIETFVNGLANQGYRVLMLAHVKNTVIDDDFAMHTIPSAIVVIQDRIRPDAPEIINYFKTQGVKIKVISGDNPVTVSSVAKRAGIENADKHISLDGMSDADIKKVASEYAVFGRVSPEQKLLLIRALKQNGDTVAMTGDGINDILAMKESDCSIAMASGSEAARNVAHLVLMDSNFASMPIVVAEGRRVINNIQRTASIFLVKTMISVLLSILTIIMNIPYPFSPKQLLLYEYFVTGIPSFFLALEITKERIKGKFINNVMYTALPGALVAILNILVINQFSMRLGITQSEIVTMSVLLTTYTGFVVLHSICKPMNVLRGVLITLMAMASLGIVIFVPRLLGLTKLNIVPMLLMFILMCLGPYALRFFKWIVKSFVNVVFVRNYHIDT